MPRKIARDLGIVILCLLLLTGCADGKNVTSGKTANPVSETYFIFDTVVTVKVFDERMTAAQFQEIERLLTRIDDEMNRQKKGSEIDQVNQQAGSGAVQVSEETFRVVKRAMEFAASSGGSFDPTVGPLVDLWGIGNEGAAVPPQRDIDAAMKLIDYKSVQLNEADHAIALAKPGMSIDLGAIAKGYAADVIAEYLADQGFKSALIDLGGNIMAMGSKPNGSDWSIGIQDPAEQRGEHLGMLKVADKTIVTSGVYERFFKENGNVYHHILSTKNGYPVNNDLLSVTIVTDVSMDADAMSTTTFTLGLEEGIKFIESRGDAEAIFVSQNKEVHITSGLKGNFTLTHGGYKLAE